MLRNFNQSLSEYELEYEKTEVRLKTWLGFYMTVSGHLKTVIERSNDHLKYFEEKDKGNVIDFGAICNIIPFRSFVNVEGVELIEDKKPARLHIRQDYQGNIQFMAVSPYFIDKDPLKKIDFMRDAVDPKDFDYNELPNILARFLDHIKDWESVTKI
jgi:hypothetical protein